jgi:hypothetical protein
VLVKLSGVYVILLAGAACGGAQSSERYVEPTSRPEGIDAEAVEVRPSYGRAEMERVLGEERRALADGSAAIEALAAQRGKAVELAVAIADQGVRQRYVLALESCRDHGAWCPPALGLSWTLHDESADVPVSLDAELRFDLASWRKLAAELWARGCDCRTMRCVDAMTHTIDVLEARPTLEVQGDHEASVAVTGARTCLWRLRGKAGRRGPAPRS